MGLRETKRADTLARIHDVAFELVNANGLTATTVDNIAEAAGLSRRTFFNYYATKEDAILGLTPICVTADARTRFWDAHGEPDELRRTVNLMLDIIANSRQGSKYFQRREQLIREFPALGARIVERRRQVQEVLLEAISREPGGEEARAGSWERATLLILFANAVLRIAYERDPCALDGDRSHVVEAALTTVKTLMREM